MTAFLAALAGVLASTAPAALASAQTAFDVNRFGTPLTDQEQEEMEGQLWWSVAFGVVDALWGYVESHDYRPRSARYWAGMATAAAIGGTVGAFGGSYARALRSAEPLGRAARFGLTAYGYVRTKVLNEALRRAEQHFYGRHRW